MHKILDNFPDNNSFFLSMIEKDKIILLKANASYEKNNFHLLVQRAIYSKCFIY